jgi:hypothetical protein
MERTLRRGDAQKQRRYFSATMPALAKERRFRTRRKEHGRPQPPVFFAAPKKIRA